MMVEIAFPKLQLVLQIPDILGDRVIIAPVAPYSSLVALGSLVSDVLDHETHKWTKYLVKCLAAAEDAGPVSSIRTAESSQSQSSQAFSLSQSSSSSSSGSSSAALLSPSPILHSSPPPQQDILDTNSNLEEEMEVGDVFDETLMDKNNPPTDVMVARRSVPLPRDVTSPLPRVSGPFHIVGAHGDEQEDQGTEVEVTDDMNLETVDNVHWTYLKPSMKRTCTWRKTMTKISTTIRSVTPELLARGGASSSW